MAGRERCECRGGGQDNVGTCLQAYAPQPAPRRATPCPSYCGNDGRPLADPKYLISMVHSVTVLIG